MKLFRKAAPAIPADVYNIPRYSFAWLLAAIVAVILPHVLRMPLWLTLTCALCIGWRVLIWQGRMSFPGKKSKTAIVLLMVVLVMAQFGRNIFSTDATVGVLLTGITLKLLEMQRKRDVLLVLYLCYFTVIAEFIYSQAIPVAVYMALAVVVITSALMSLNQTQDNQKPWRTFRHSAGILLQGVPLMLAFFLLFPRISPLWAVPMNTAGARTGLSDSMSPGDIGDLARSAEVAFRISFEGSPPPYSELYWRALTLDEFDGRRWRRPDFFPQPQFLGPRGDLKQPWFEAIEYLGSPVSYNVIMEPTNQNWIYTLQMPETADERLLMRSDYQLGSVRRINQRFSYDVRSWLEFSVGDGLSAGETRRTLQIPQESNQRAAELAQQLRETVGSDAAYVSAVLTRFRNEEFIYTLSPPLLGDNPVDEFLFETRAGFCEHFASAFTYLMRAAGIPSRVVTGYMGGEYNPYDSTLTVRQYDAHAWSEVWLEGQGWVRFDPTAAVAPERVEQGSNEVLQEEDQFMQDEMFTLMRFSNSQLLNELRYRLEMMDYAWNRFVLNYDQDMQFNLFSRLFGTVTKLKILLVIVGFMALAGVVIAWLLFRLSPVDVRPVASRLYLRFCKVLGKQGFVRAPGETPQQYMQRISAANPQWRDDVEAITQLYVELAYISRNSQPDKLRELQRRVRRFRLLS
jgi:transglutaminase-like putative cysteine protease